MATADTPYFDTFDEATVTAERITEDADYEGVRVKFVGFLENARIPIQIDLGFGDAVTPAAIELALDVLENPWVLPS